MYAMKNITPWFHMFIENMHKQKQLNLKFIIAIIVIAILKTKTRSN